MSGTRAGPISQVRCAEAYPSKERAATAASARVDSTVAMASVPLVAADLMAAGGGRLSRW
ncbi:hypothetical protein [Micromonospora sp. NBS 11-29]|uniref:hypothetical protein n=1 Tax=Micromonospora sp. NBS 11-29 TaxID=1960879 RepID=UPI000B78C636|nr:hypothetical protein [Micromonospora sp. NBS 11-29]